MSSARPLKDLFTDAVGAGDAATVADLLAAGGHPDLPTDLVAEAVVSFADGAPPELAEALAPFVRAYGPVPAEDAVEVEPGGWLELLAGADVDTDPAGADLDAEPADLDATAPTDVPPAVTEEGAEADGGPFDLDFGHGAGSEGTAMVGEAVADGGWLGGLLHDGGQGVPTEGVGDAVAPETTADPSFVEGLLDIVDGAADEPEEEPEG